MYEKKKIHLDFEIDKLTNSIENAISGEVFETLITKLKTADNRQINKVEWTFNWQTDFKDKTKQVFKLTTVNKGVFIIVATILRLVIASPSYARLAMTRQF